MTKNLAIDRRKFLFISTIGGVFAAAGYGVYQTLVRNQHDPVIKFLKNVGTKVSPRWAPTLCGYFDFSGKSNKELITETISALGLEHSPSSRTRIGEALEIKVQKDLSANGTLLINNWILTNTEAKLYCLSYLYVQSEQKDANTGKA